MHCSFLIIKSRLAPLKQTTIPRLELTAATVAVRIGHLMLEELDIVVDRVFYHTDSTTVLHYIYNEKKRFPIFVANRVQFIRDYSQPHQWRYVNTKDNPADNASRGMSVDEIIQCKSWINAPDFGQSSLGCLRTISLIQTQSSHHLLLQPVNLYQPLPT